MLTVAITVQVVLIVGAGALFALEAVLSRRRTARTARVAPVRALVVKALAEEQHAAAAVQGLRALPEPLAMSLAVDFADALSGSSLDALRRLAMSAGLTGRARAWCGSRRWWRRLRGIRLLTRLDADAADLVEVLLADPVEVVRAAAAEAAARHPTPLAVASLVAMLDDPSPLCRYSATASLAAGGRLAGDGLLPYLTDPSAARLDAAMRAAAVASDVRFLPVAVRLAGSPEAHLRRGSADLLAAIGGAEGISALVRLARDDDPSVRVGAVAGLARAGGGSEVALLADRLRDPDFDVRRAAALALRGFGAPGRLYLRRAARGSDGPEAVDLAQHALDLPDGVTDEVPG